MPARTNRKWLGLAGLCLLMGVLVVCWRGGSLQSGRGDEVAHVAATATRGEGANSTTAGLDALKPTLSRRSAKYPADASRLPALQPPIGTKVADVVAMLRDAADHGDVAAACRVGIELGRCWQQRYVTQLYQSQYDKAVAEHAAPDVLAAALDSIRDASRLYAPDKALCEGLPDAAANEAWSYTLQAASAGSGAAAAYFLMAPPAEAFSDGSEVLDAWAEHREQFLQTAIASGDVHALYEGYFLAIAGFGQGGMSRKFPKDPYAAIVYGNAVLPFVDPASAAKIQAKINGMAGNLSESEAQRAAADGDNLRARYYGSAAPVGNITSIGEPNAAGCAPGPAGR